MAGGLIQIANYGSQDLFLTGAPEITFFKIVYRRHTNFSMESVRIDFDDVVSFGSTSISTIPKVGDLMFKTYLQIELPEINLFRQIMPDSNEFEIIYNNALNDYEILFKFMTINRNAFVSAYDIFIAENNINATQDMINTINNIFDIPGTNEIIEQFQAIMATTQMTPFTYNEVSMDSIANTFDTESEKNALFRALSIGIDKSIKTQEFFFIRLKKANEALEDSLNQNIKFAWVNRIGHAIIQTIDVRIGGQKIDRHYGDWLNIWYELSANRNLEKTYFKLIGNVPELTDFNRNIKPKYLLRIPLQFWFCRFNGLALPLVALEYQEVTFNVKFRKFQELCYIEPHNLIRYSRADDGITLEEVPEEMNININASFLIDFIYLDGPERKRFAQSSHEYLIEQLQVLQRNDIIKKDIQININNFVHPSKELVWVTQKQSYLRNNNEGSNQCRWDNYSMTNENIGNPIEFSSLDFHGYSRVIKLDGNYFNYVQPYETHSTTPSDGINMYSFSIFPEEEQPSGTANLSRLDRILLSLQLNPILFEHNTIIDPIVLRVYTRNINILRFISGYSAPAFTFG